jgi:nucleoside-diphosphate-sugar epimerase
MSILCLQQKNRIIRAVVCTVIFLLYTTSTITTTIANKEKKVLVTGGMGNIGKYLVKELLGMGYSVICMDIQNLTSPDMVELYRGSNVSFYSRFYEFVRMDIRDLDGWYNLLRMEKPSINGIIHLAAVSRVSFCLDNELDCRDINERGTQVITDAVAKYVASGGKKPWLIFASSREIYGESCLPGSPCNEVSPPQPLNLYGETKLIGERILEGTNKIFEGRIVIRLASVYGGLYDQPERFAHVQYTFFEEAF